jgi:capsular exopolysaccharide synthesis family protein
MESGNEQVTNKSDKANILSLIAPYLRYWYIIVLSALIFGVSAYLNLNTQTKVYSSSSQVLVKDQANSGASSELDIFADLGIPRNNSNLSNKILVLTSRPLIREVVKALNLNIDIYEVQGLFQPNRYYYGDNQPFIVNASQCDSTMQEAGIRLEVVFEDEHNFKINRFQRDDRVSLGSYQFNQPIKTYLGEIILEPNSLNKRKANAGNAYVIQINSITSTTNQYKGSFKAAPVESGSTVLSLSVNGQIPKRNEDFLNKLVKIHELQTIEDRNEITIHTSQFIAERMDVIEKELSNVEKMGENFKKDNDLINVEVDAQKYAGKEEGISEAIDEILLERKLIDFIREYLDERKDISMLLPEDLGISDDGSNALISGYNELIIERNKIVANSSQENPLAERMKDEIKTIRDNLNLSLDKLRESKNLLLNELRIKERQFQNKLSNIPEFERKYREIERQQQIKETLYLYLLQKREENQIAMASAVGNIQIVEEAITGYIPISPKRRGTILTWLLIGLAIPIGIIYLKEYLDNKVHSREDLEGIGIPVVAEIPQHKTGNNLVIHKEDRSIVAEAFRMLRNNMNFLLPRKKEGGNIVFVSSSIAGEGKTFNSINLANSLALIDKKVVLVGLDLRAPKITEYLDMIDGPGVTNYLINDKLTLDEITTQSKDLENLDYIISGDIPPNPSELLMRPRLDEFFKQLREKYDYVIVDNAPTTLVVDTMSVIHHSDLFLYVVRANFLDKRILADIASMKANDKVKNIAFILNDVDFKHAAYRSYGYGYGYGNAEAYGAEHAPGAKRKKRRLLNPFRRK